MLIYKVSVSEGCKWRASWQVVGSFGAGTPGTWGRLGLLGFWPGVGVLKQWSGSAKAPSHTVISLVGESLLIGFQLPARSLPCLPW